MMKSKNLFVGTLRMKDPNRWMVGDKKFTVNARANAWVVKYLKRFRLEHATVEVWLSDKNTLLSARAL